MPFNGIMQMKRYLLLIVAGLCALLDPAALRAQEPLYIVNGVERASIGDIPPELIERAERLPADEQTIARYGTRASNGVLLITLHHDRQARFTGEGSFDEYIARHVEWPDDEPAARVVLRYEVTPEGRAVVTRELESTDRRLRRRVLQAIEEAPSWEPATKAGRPVASEGVLRIQLPAGKPMPREVEVVYR